MPTGIHDTGLRMWVTKQCDVQKDYQFNDRFKVLLGHKFWIGNELVFPVHEEQLGFPHSRDYRMVYGFAFAHNGVIWRDDNHGMRLAMRRHFAKRMPTHPVPYNPDLFDQWLRISQRAWIDFHEEQFTTDFINSFGTMDWTCDIVESARLLCLMEHKKRKLRVEAYNEMLISLDFYKDKWMRTSEWKVKRDEVAKNGKYPRIIVDLGVSASLQGALWAMVAKKFLDSSALNCTVNGAPLRIKFIGSPRPAEITDELLRIWGAGYGVTALVFSDDACACIQSKDFRVVANLDFSSNDASKTERIWELMFDVLQCPTDVRTAMMAQVKSAFRVESSDGKNCAVFLPLETYLPSGITMTTILNTFSWYITFYHLAFSLRSIHSADDVITCIEDLGHPCSISECEIIQDLQFLKMSPVVNTSGNYCCVLNPGVIYRASGVCRKDLPGSGSVYERSCNFQHSIMHGMLSGVSNPTLTSLDPGGKLITLTDDQLPGTLQMVDFSEVVKEEVDDHELFKRYRLADFELCELRTMSQNCGVGQVAYSEAVWKILTKDYDLGAPTREFHEHTI